MLLKNDPVNAFVDYDAVEVPSAATGPLKGLTFAVKDIYDVAGYPTGGGSPIKRAESPIHTETAPIVAAMLDGGRALRRQDADRRADVFDERAEQAFSRAGQRARRGAHHRRLLVRLGGGGGGRPLRLRASAPTRAARCARRRAIAGSGASARRMGACRSAAPCRSRRPSTRPAISPTTRRSSPRWRRCSSARTSGPSRLSRLVARRRRLCAADVRSRGGGAAAGRGEGRGGARRRPSG